MICDAEGCAENARPITNPTYKEILSFLASTENRCVSYGRRHEQIAREAGRRVLNELNDLHHAGFIDYRVVSKDGRRFYYLTDKGRLEAESFLKK